MKYLVYIFFVLIVSPGNGQLVTPIQISSPDKSTVMQVRVGASGDAEYRITWSGKPVLNWSTLGLETLQSGKGEKTSFLSKTDRSQKESFTWRLGENERIVSHYNETTISYRQGQQDARLIVRAFDGSIAFRYALTSNDEGKIRKEKTGFVFPSSTTIYQYNQESVYTPGNIDTMTRSCDLPATLTNGNVFLSIGEADNRNYSKGELVKDVEPHSLSLIFKKDSVIRYNGAYQTPWRTVSISNTAIGLHAFSDLYLKLVPPPGNLPDWIKPGKLIRSQLDTKSGLDCIDFAAKHNFQYIMFDAGWYGAEFQSTSDPTQVIPQLDMKEVIAHGKEKGIGVILYVNYVGLKQKLDTILPLYKKWGVAGLKFGFVDGLSQAGLSWLSAAIEKVNRFGFVLNIHDNYKPTGLSRSFPALLTQEGIRGDENSPDAFHNTVLPFTRFLAGPADFTFCYPNEKNSYAKNIKVTKGQQLALTVVYFSPLQSIFWYGRPNDYTNEEEIEFFTHVPTVWSESRYIAGEIGKNVSVARRSDATWFIGNVAGESPWQTNLKLDFLTAGKKYTATIYEDDGKGSIRKRKLAVKKGDNFSVELLATGGQAIMIEPA